MSAGKNVNRFLRAAEERLEDAHALTAAGRHAGAIYLGGYAVECGLKALLLANVPSRFEMETQDSFRGAAAHDFLGLRHRCEGVGVNFPPHLARNLRSVREWDVADRYNPAGATAARAAEFLAAAAAILNWVRSNT